MYEAIAAASEPLLVLRLPEELILSAADSARTLLAPDGSELVGRALPEFLDAPAGDAAELLAKGRLDGFQLHRIRTAEPAGPLELWVVRSGQPAAAEPALALLSPAALRWATEPEVTAAPFGIGWADRRLLLQQVSEEVTELLGLPIAELLDTSLLELTAPEDLTTLLFALGQLARSREAVSLTIKLVRPDQNTVRCQLVLAPIHPAPSVAFALRPAPEPAENEDPRLLLRRFGQGVAAAASARELVGVRARPLLPELTSRELQIVNRLLAGDRVPAISRQLYLAQSTVRNHLSAVFAKLGVRSQQELIVLLRKVQSRE
jgi:DNA-binding CsgD family transcriptional regulator